MSLADSSRLVFEVVHFGTIAAGGSGIKNIANVYHFRRTNTPGLATNANIAAAFAAAIIPAVTNALNVDYTGTLVGCRCINDAQENMQFVADTTAGQVAGERLPGYNAAVLILKTDLRGANYRGRKHYAPMSEGDSVDDVLTAGSVTLMNAIAAAILAGFTDANGNIFVPAVVSRNLSQLATNPTTVVATDVTSILTNKTLGTMRRRKTATVR